MSKHIDGTSQLQTNIQEWKQYQDKIYKNQQKILVELKEKKLFMEKQDESEPSNENEDWDSISEENNILDGEYDCYFDNCFTLTPINIPDDLQAAKVFVMEWLNKLSNQWNTSNNEYVVNYLQIPCYVGYYPLTNIVKITKI